ncbi:hypothetical protein [Escherichia coli]|uniref:hypothetical protein n=1 Tax=Escherichia coli TaxID=562 RepID=UPI00345C3E9A
MHRCRLTADLEIAAQNTDAQTCFLNVSDILSYIIVQRLLKTKDGRRKAVREYLVIDNSLRRKLYDVDYSKWGRYIDDLLIAENRSLIQNAWAMHQEGLIDEAEVIEVAGYMDYLALKEGKYGH